jgi:hypothetical protein
MIEQEEAEMHFRKTIVLVALAAVAAAPSALAMRTPPEIGDPGTHILTSESGLHKKTNPKQPTLCVRQLQAQTRCLAFGF